MKTRLTVLAMACILTLALGGLVACSSSSSSAAASGSASASASSASASAASASASAASASASSASAAAALADGVYTAKFTTDSTMFHVNEFYKDKVTLTVENGQMTIHAPLASDGIINLYLGKAEDAEKDGATLIDRTLEKVDFGDGTEPEEVSAFDIPVPVLDEPFDLAILGTKGKWYDHVVSVSDVEPAQQ